MGFGDGRGLKYDFEWGETVVSTASHCEIELDKVGWKFGRAVGKKTRIHTPENRPED